MNIPRRAWGFIVLMNLGQLPIALRGLLVVLVAHHNTGSFAVAGGAAGAASLGLAVTAPWFGRSLASRGHRPVLLLLGLVSLGAHVALTLATSPGMFIVLSAIVGLTTPPVASSARALIPVLVSPTVVGRAYTGNAIAQELLFVLGPLWISLWMWVTSAPGALLASALVGTAGLIGGALMAPPGGPPTARRPSTRTPLRRPPVRTLLTVYIGYWACMGAMWVLVPAFATQLGRPGYATLLITIWALGSLAGGTLFILRRPRAAPHALYLTLLGLLTATALPLAMASTLPQMGLALAVFGVGLAPWLAVGDELVARTASTDASEVYGWLVTAGQIGSAVGSSLAGPLAERQASGPAFLLVAAALSLALVTALTRARTLREQRTPDRDRAK